MTGSTDRIDAAPPLACVSTVGGADGPDAQAFPAAQWRGAIHDPSGWARGAPRCH
jgi:hypothetical protein